MHHTNMPPYKWKIIKAKQIRENMIKLADVLNLPITNIRKSMIYYNDLPIRRSTLDKVKILICFIRTLDIDIELVEDCLPKIWYMIKSSGSCKLFNCFHIEKKYFPSCVNKILKDISVMESCAPLLYIPKYDTPMYNFLKGMYPVNSRKLDAICKTRSIKTEMMYLAHHLNMYHPNLDLAVTYYINIPPRKGAFDIQKIIACFVRTYDDHDISDYEFTQIQKFICHTIDSLYDTSNFKVEHFITIANDIYKYEQQIGYTVQFTTSIYDKFIKLIAREIALRKKIPEFSPIV
jgi:hypothetical protein